MIMVLLSGSGGAESPTAMKHMVREAQQKIGPSLVRVKMYAKAPRTNQAQGRGGPIQPSQPAGEVKPTETSGIALNASEVLMPYTMARKGIEKVELWWDGAWRPAVVAGENQESGFTVLKAERPQSWPPARWRSASLEDGGWGVATFIGTEEMGYRVAASPVWIVTTGKDPQGASDFVYISFPPSHSAVLGTADGEIIGFLQGTRARWIDEKFLKTVDTAKSAAPSPDGETTGDGWLGLNLGALTDAYREGLQVPTKKSARIQDVAPASPASRADLRVNDVILKINGKALEREGGLASGEVLQAVKKKPGETVTLTVWRDHRELDVTCTLQKMPVAKTALSDQLGLGVSEILPASARLYQLKTDQGVLVHQVTSGGPAMYAGLRSAQGARGTSGPPTVLTEMDGVPITGLNDFYEALTSIGRHKNQPILVKGYRGIEFFMIIVDLAIGAKRPDKSSESSSTEEDQP